MRVPLRFTRAMIAVYLFSLAAALAPRPARAMSSEVRGVIRIGGYGILGGTLLGLTAYPMTGKVQTVFLGSSVGLYVGLAIGLVYALESEHEPAPWQQSFQEMPLETTQATAAAPPALFVLNTPVYRF